MNRDEGRLSDAAVHALTLDTDPWMSCDDCFAQVDSEIERLVSDGERPSLAFLIHLRGCAACRDEAATLAALLADDAGKAISSSVARLDSAIATARGIEG